ncbi:MAG: MTH1187 family thiamine-binding protein [Alphaproteobacteria bacterium]|jgi:uncharacterized protein (TIGR00106 family)|nr:MTH1187 family thiamine-binding protein [Alphaproteobacteria bacterium]
MWVSVELCVVPLGVGVSVSFYIAACQRVLREAGFETELHAYGTNFEGEWDEVMDAVRKCHEQVHDLGAPRIFTTLKLGTRTDRDQRLADKISSVEAQIGATRPS